MLLPFEEKRTRAWMVTRKQAILEQFGAKHAPLIEPLDDLTDLQSYVLPLFSQAIKERLFLHGTFIEDRLTELTQQRGWGLDVPYADDFASFFARTVAEYDPLQVVEFMELKCRQYVGNYPSFFLATKEDYLYLRDILYTAQYEKTVPDTPSLLQAMQWLDERAADSKRAANAQPYMASLSRQHAASEDDGTIGWDGILIGEYKQADVEALLVALTLLEGHGPGKYVTSSEQKASKWLGVLFALQAERCLTANCEAVARVFRAAYGALVSARAMQNRFKPENELQNSYYNRTKAWLKQHRTS